ncbi:hypothetical protein Q8A67_025276 [Cirrhinus molitorella]|uniref:Uncharacterized protein n=1 Tax=Cirrhinus molitorella TaxID=172907 RepID=A0AA88NZR2_9TELE|nr:hypothetical protein Q8A67_025276 [Cirrhinus molitorella]
MIGMLLFVLRVWLEPFTSVIQHTPADPQLSSVGRLLPAHQYSAGRLPDLSPVETEHLRGFDPPQYSSGFGRVNWHEDRGQMLAPGSASHTTPLCEQTLRSHSSTPPALFPGRSDKGRILFPHILSSDKDPILSNCDLLLVSHSLPSAYARLIRAPPLPPTGFELKQRKTSEVCAGNRVADLQFAAGKHYKQPTASMTSNPRRVEADPRGGPAVSFSLNPDSRLRLSQEGGGGRKKENADHLTSIAQRGVCVPRSHWYLDETYGAVTRALLQNVYDVIEVPSLQAADEAALDGPGQFPRLFGRDQLLQP